MNATPAAPHITTNDLLLILGKKQVLLELLEAELAAARARIADLERELKAPASQSDGSAA